MEELDLNQKRLLLIAKARGRAAEQGSYPTNTKSDNSMVENFGLGVARGARDLVDGPAYLLPKAIENLSGAVGLDGVANWARSEADRVSDINKAAESQYQNATPGSAAAGFGRVGGNVASAFIPGTGQISASKKINDLWKSGNYLTSLGAASGLGATQSALFGTKTNDDSLLQNTAVGAALAPIGQGVASAIQLGRKLLAGKDGRVGGVLQRAGQDTPENLVNRIYSGNNVIVEGANPTTAQAAMNPGLSQLERTIRNNGYNALVDRDLINNQARIAALEKIAPGSFGTTSIDAAQNAGEAIRSQAQGLRGQLTNEINAAYNHPELASATLELPDQLAAINAIKKYFPGIAYPEAPGSLRGMAERLPTDGVINAESAGAQVPLSEFDAYKKLFANRWADLRDVDRTGAAAYSEVKQLFDNAEKAAIRDGSGSNMSPDQLDLLKAARRLYQQDIDRFETGPASYLWRTGPDKLPLANGAEIAKRLFNSGASQAADIAQLGKMLPDGGIGKEQLQKYAISDLIEKALNTGGDLSAGKYQSWVNSRSPAIRGLFNDDQVGTLNNVGADLARAYEAQNLGRAIGSNTIQNAMGSSILDGVIGSYIKKRAPGIVGDFIDAGVNRYRNRVADEVGGAMLYPDQAIDALEVYQKLMNPNIVQRGLLKSAPLVVPATDY